MTDIICPDCGSPMVERKNRSDGRSFYGCSRYPACRKTLKKEIDRRKSRLALSAEDRLRWAEGVRNAIAKRNKVNYYAYLKSAKWKEKKAKAEQNARYRCQVCNRSRFDVTLNVHHRTYERLGNEYLSDLIVLCRDCHQLYHDRMDELDKYPTK